MKKLLIALTLATVAASSASAKTPSTAPAVDPMTVIVNGQVLGRDPDPGIRFQLMREDGLQAD
jgi:hypothetical protein